MRAQALRQIRQNPNNAAEMAVIRSVGRHTLFVRWLRWDNRQAGEKRPLYEVDPSDQMRGHSGTVKISKLTWLQFPGSRPTRATSLARLRPNMPVLIGGVIAGSGMRADVIVDLAGVHPAHLTRGVFRSRSFAPAMKLDSRQNSLNFSGSCCTGSERGYSTEKRWNGDGILIFHIGIMQMRLKRAAFRAGIVSTFNWPFRFAEDTGAAIVPGSRSPIGLQVIPEAPPSGYSSEVHVGVSAGIDLHITTEVGCGDVLLSSCTFTPELNVGLTNSVGTKQAPPMPGQSVRLEALACPVYGIYAIPVLDWGLALKSCMTTTFRGAPFTATVSATGATVVDPTDPNLQFDGNPAFWKRVDIVPNGTSVHVRLSNFYWAPDEITQHSFWIGINPIESAGFEVDTVSKDQGATPMVGSPEQLAQQHQKSDSQPRDVAFDLSGDLKPTNEKRAITEITINGYPYGTKRAVITTADFNKLSAKVNYKADLRIPIAKEPVSFQVGTAKCTGVTNASGIATCQLKITVPGPATLVVTTLTANPDLVDQVQLPVDVV
jgi:hypothetical protein